MDRVTADDYIFQLVDQVRFLLVLNRRAKVNFHFFRKSAVGTSLLQFRRGLVQLS